MKNQLNYQTSEYDCGPTTLINAFRYLFEREEIVPEIIKTIFLYTLDLNNDCGEYGKSGTSHIAMMFLSNWFNQFSKTKKYPIYTEYLQNEKVLISQTNKIIECLQQGGAVILRVWLGDCKHYILLTDVEEDYICLFDPYESDEAIDNENILKIEGYPNKMNRKVKINIFNKKEVGYYTLGDIEERDAMLLYNTTTRKTPEKSIEYFI